MSAKRIRARSQGPQVRWVDSVRSTKSATDEIAKPSRRRTRKPRPGSGDLAFDPETFLARAGLGRKILSLKKDALA